MLLFKRLFQGGSKLRDKRSTRRHPVGPGFPLKGSVNLLGRDTLPKPGTSISPDAGCIWSGRPANLSRSGVSLQLPPAAITVRGEQTELELSLENHRLRIPCVVAHFRSSNSHSLCGLTLKFSDEKTETAYVQLLDTLAIAASFVPLKGGGPKHKAGRPLCEQFVADNKFLLTAWRDDASREVAGLELLLGDFCVKGDAGAKELEIYSRDRAGTPGHAAVSAPAFGLSAGLHAEVRQLYRWLVLNLPKTVPADLRTLAERFIRKTDIFPPV